MAFSCQLLVHFGLLIILQLHFLFLGVSPATLSITIDTEALISFKSQLRNDTLIPLSSWNQSSSPCNWTGVQCDTLNQRVISLELPSLGLSGQLSPYICNLSSLQSLQLQDNQLTGLIPDQIGNLFSLKVLNMSSNMLEGKLPSNITLLNQLQILDLSSNKIVSQIPQDIGSLKKLEVLKLGKNSLYGAIPASLGNISSLKNISLGTNFLTGWIPSDLGRLHDLIELDLVLNNLNGTVPPAVYNLSSLVNFALASNSLWGEIPQDVGLKLPKLIVFNICFNYFTGGIPGSLHNLTNIQVIRMASNLLEGTVPPGLGNLPFLRMYNIGGNRIVSSGVRGLDFITSLTNSTRLKFLAIDGNMLEGVIPETVGNLSKDLSTLYMGQNRFNGSIPRSIALLSGLKLLNISHNSISGEIPHELGQLAELQELSLAGNEISGVIPDSLGNLLKLNLIDLSRNKLVGRIPTSFGNLQSLLYMDLSSNQLNGSIPVEMLNLQTLSNVLNLSMNSLSGPIPQIGRLSGVASIDFSSNQLDGDIPSSFSNCLSLESLFLNRNQLSGSIPKALGEVRALETLDLSTNRLSGTIPVELQNLQVLRLLNLSYNDLEGAIPSGGVFQNVSAIHLEGNENLCLQAPCVNRGEGRRNVRYYILIAVAVALVLFLTIGSILYIKSRKVKVATLSSSSSPSEQLKPLAPMISYDELRLATEEFNQENLLGVGSFGSVYKGNLSHGTTVAVKILDTLRTGSLKSFFAECEAMKNSRHRNLVKLITSCSSVDFKNNDFRALVYEYMCNGSLEDWIKGKRKHANGNGLNLMERLNIAIDVACALDYLHNDSEIPVVHCDLKPSNILLNEDMTAKVGDFGLARLLVQRSTNQVSISSTHALRGSIGYIPPEYGWGEKVSAAGDVYSFGIVLLELFSGKSPTDECFTGGLSIRRWMHSAFKEKTMEAIDPELVSLILHDDPSEGPNNVQVYCVEAIVGVAISCTADNPDERIGIRDAVSQLKSSRDSLLNHSDHTSAAHTNSYLKVLLK
ncbi:putative receptor-like protein kinase At3g47110 [Vigna radiata var. radiata]|uniref:non-specific serine/threonine protein kinase n=1 Tax=Vigna radiata var. radiata TaxID=3916 RepID=A0A1S3UJB2_VIGRR|nr:putative receptor-like protein kinase At3g47110 [Vigna radiata var. radiata]